MSTSLFSLDCSGRVYRLSTDSTQWKPLRYQNIDFKKISACHNTIWAIGADSQIYVYFYGSDVSIKREVETYENQRWNPIGGFCAKLLPTDRYQFSSKDGLEEMRFDMFCLPSPAWRWEGDWVVDPLLDGSAVTEQGGWQYAVDFPAVYRHERFFSACVRRRRWRRHQRYVAVRTWSVVPLLDEMADDMVVDLAVGGQDIAGAEAGAVLVWAVTISGQVYVRRGVCARLPDGAAWLPVPVPPRASHVCQVTCAGSGLVWLLCWNGAALVRTGVTRHRPQGEVWCTVMPPSGVELRQLSVGSDSVWSVSSEGRVFFRKDVKSQDAGSNQLFCTGSSWLEIFSSMRLVSVGPYNQVFGVDTERRICVRTSVTNVEPTGRLWRPITASLGTGSRDPTDARTAASSAQCVTSVVEAAAAIPLSAQTVGRQHQPRYSDGGDIGVAVDSASFLSHRWSDVTAGACVLTTHTNPPWFEHVPSPAPSGELWHQQLLQSLQARSISLLPFTDYDKAIECNSWLKSDKCRWIGDPAAGGSALTVGALLELQMHGSDRQRLDSASVGVYTHGTCRLRLSLEEVTCVMNVSPSLRLPTMCVFSLLQPHRPLAVRFSDETTLSDWLAALSDACARLRGLPDMAGGVACLWACTARGDVFCSDQQCATTERHLLEQSGGGFRLLADTSVPCDGQVSALLEHGFSVGSRLLISYHRSQAASRFSVNLQAGSSSQVWFHSQAVSHTVSPLASLAPVDILYHFNPRFDQKVVVSNARLGSAGWGQEQRLGSSCAILSQMGGDIELICQKDYIKVMCAGECILFNHRDSADRISHVTIVGEVSLDLVEYWPERVVPVPRYRYWRQIAGAHLSRVECGAAGQVWGLGSDGTPWIYMASDTNHETGAKYQMTDVKCYYTYENQRWNPVSGFTRRGLPTDRFSWSDRTGVVECLKEWVAPPSSQWHWITEWMVDFTTPDGVDDNGWQYAVDFPASYHGYSGIKDFVRRRRWVRKCQLLCDSSWRQAANLQITDISLSCEAVEAGVPVWAVTSDGQLVYTLSPCAGRHTQHNPHLPPAVQSAEAASAERVSGVPADFKPSHLTWHTVGTDEPVCAVSCGSCVMGAGAGTVWTVTRSGSALVRFGVSQHSPAGAGWIHVAPPAGGKLCRVSVGERSVWGVDSLNRLFWRCEVSSVCPEGTCWLPIATGGVRHVSCGAGDVTWAVCEGAGGAEPGGSGMLAQRVGVCEADGRGSWWHQPVEGNWTYVSCRGALPPAPNFIDNSRIH